MIEFLLGMYVGRNADRGGRSMAHAASHEAHRASSKAEDLQAQVDRLTLFSLALAELLVERGGTTEPAILAKVEEIDLRDGRRDAKSRPNKAPQACPACKRVLAAYHVQCIYCGVTRPNVSPENYLGR
jgi:hypothetical protein